MEPKDLLHDTNHKKEIKASEPKSPLVLLEDDLKLFMDSIKEISQDIIQEEVSKYPIFIAHQEEVKVGELILDKNELASNFSISVTYLEECVEKRIILNDKINKFIAAYRDPTKFVCILAVIPQGANFVFYPYS